MNTSYDNYWLLFFMQIKPMLSFPYAIIMYISYMHYVYCMIHNYGDQHDIFYFDLYMNGLQPERYYTILIKTTINGSTLVFDNNYSFKIING